MPNKSQAMNTLKANMLWQKHLAALDRGDIKQAEEWLDKIDELDFIV